jgi:anti-sigma B factor antagonist
MTTALHIKERRVGPVVVLDLSGRLVVYDGEERFREHVATLIRAGHLNVLLDLRQVDYIDSGGVGSVVAALLHVTRRGGRLKLLSPSPRVAHVLEIAGLDHVVEIFDREEDAVASFAPPAATPAF